jgi:hypothetical protein
MASLLATGPSVRLWSRLPANWGLSSRSTSRGASPKTTTRRSYPLRMLQSFVAR